MLTVRVNSPELGYLNVRDQPDGALVTTAPHGSTLNAAEPDTAARAKVGQEKQWLKVRLPDGREAYVAAWYLTLADAPAAGSGLPLWVYSPEVGSLNIRSGPSTNHAILTQALHKARVLALDAESDVRAKLGKQGEWIRVRLDNGTEGYGAANYLSPVSPPEPDRSLEPDEADKIAFTNSMSGSERQVATIWNRLGGLMKTLAAQLGIDPGMAVAVWLVESGGRAFGADGRMVIRFENHVFDKYWGKQAPQLFAQHFTYNSDQSWTGHQWRPSPSEGWRQFHNNQATEWEVFSFAATLDKAAAQSSISMGGPQIMGFNYKSLDYPSVGAMFDAFAAGEGHQVIGFFNFIRNNRGGQTLQKLQSSDFVGFATHYNGPGQAAHYGALIQQSYEAFHRLKAVSFAVSFAAEEVGPAPMTEVDNLRIILGMGAKSVARLKAEGVTTFTQIAALDAEQLRALIGPGANRLRWLESWPLQARLAAWGDWDALKALQAELKG